MRSSNSLLATTVLLLTACPPSTGLDAGAALENTLAACKDGVDNDGDGFTDCADQDCWAVQICLGDAGASPDAGGAGDSDTGANLIDGGVPDASGITCAVSAAAIDFRIVATGTALDRLSS